MDLIYIDPPFNVGADFSFQVEIEDERFTKEASIIEQKAYRDTWGRGLDSYMQWFYETTLLLYDLLSETGSFYIHLDWHVIHYAKVVLDEVFGEASFRNEITWKRSSIATNINTQWRNSHDTLLFYTKTNQATFNVQYGEYSESSKKHFSQEDERGVFQPVPLLGSGKTVSGETGQVWRGIDPNTLGKDGMYWLKNRVFWMNSIEMEESIGRQVVDFQDSNII